MTTSGYFNTYYKPAERPFGFIKDKFYVEDDSYYYNPNASKDRPSPTTVSFTATRLSKVASYIPLVGTAIGVYQIYLGIKEYQQLNKKHYHDFSKRSIIWILRGALVSIPVIGGVICLIIDLIATLRNIGNHQIDRKISTNNSVCIKTYTCPKTYISLETD